MEDRLQQQGTVEPSRTVCAWRPLVSISHTQGWRERYFVLSKGRLSYYKNDKVIDGFSEVSILASYHTHCMIRLVKQLRGI